MLLLPVLHLSSLLEKGQSLSKNTRNHVAYIPYLLWTCGSMQTFFSLLFISVMASFSVSASSPISNNQMDSENMSALEKHVAFFDRNKDGVIYPSETYAGFRAIGCGIGLSTASATFIHVGLSSKTRPGKSPSPLFPIEVKNIARGKHGSDSGAYDSEGRFVESKFEEIFSKHSRTNSSALTEEELKTMLQANGDPKDSAGRLASSTEWNILYLLAKDKNGFLQKETVRAVYDGSLFEQMEKNHKASKQ